MNRNKLISLIVKIIFWVGLIVFFSWAFSNDMFLPIFEEPGAFFNLLGEHLILVLISGSLAILTSIPLGIFLTRPRFRKVEFFAVNIANLGQTIPSLAILALVMGFMGIGMEAALVALFAYSVLPILQNTIAGINSVDEDKKDAARGMGLTNTQILWRIELPNAAYSIIAGVRTALVMNIGTAALAYLIGGGGFGVWIFTGIQLFDNAYLISGAVPVSMLAIAVDYLFRGMQFVLVPKGLRLARQAVS
ncbi:osmoprotectant transport system permease protein [Lentibacillus persicus]|uniref:Osmoprotectant transport system permease protein n=1 Tax=Lentibacillus persicus TaxID=640948 RepID=A0A1I2AJJ8_9BACI|nr:ABC transporter permease [Lentibacillus persicus]SFE44194.1 osmoprotectant transport system permease protein [Lentibacillus persicus]